MYSYYVIKKGDTLYSIASRFNTTVGELRNLNNLSPNKILMPGEVITVPVNQDMMGQNNNIGNNNDLFTTYTVQRGDNLYSIANKYNTTVNEIKSLNNLTSNNLSIGQQLRIPTNASGNITYTVQKGDNLYSIARKYNTTVNEIKRKNNLTSNNLSIGQQLII